MTLRLRDLSIGRRLTALSAAFVLPAAVMLALIVANIRSDIAFSESELTGNAYQRPLEALLDSLSAHRRDNATDTTRRVDEAFEALAAMDAQFGEALQFTPAGLAQRKRDHILPATVRREWQTLKTAPEPDRHAHLIADVRSMIAHAGDTSNLILDPDLDSFYVMDATLVALPQTQDRLASMVAMLEGLGPGGASVDQRQALAVSAALLKESDLDRIAAAITTALNDDVNFHGISDTLQRQLPPALAAYRQAAEAFIVEVERLTQTAGASPAAAAAAGWKARDASFALWSTAADELDVLLNTRVATQRRALTTALGLSGIAWAAALAFAFVITRSTTRALTAVTDDLTTAASETTAAASQVARSAQSLSQGATEQAASLEETSASMEEMASMTRQNAENSHTAAGLMGEVDARVQTSNAALAEMVVSMTSIEESSEQVARIIRTIDEIAFQTNILALNAAVEAARAGEAGMGFAVVADEVRNLAQRSAQAARDTAGLIEASVEKSRVGAARVGQVAASIAGITESVGRVKTLIEEVSVASREQTQGIDQVAQAVSQMEKVTQTTAATAEESAAASEELSAQAESSLASVRILETIVGTSAAARPAVVAPAGVARGLARAALIALVVGSGTAYGQTSRPGPHDVPELVTDRPDFTESSEVIPRGWLQLEGGISLEGDTQDATSHRGVGLPAALLRLGLGFRTELRVSAEGLVSESTPGSRSSGHSDMELGAKLRLLNQSSAGIDLALLPFVSLPTGAPGFTSGGLDPTLKVTWARDLPAGFGLTGNVNTAWLSEEGARFQQHALSFSLGHALAAGWGGYAEAYGFSKMSRDSGAGVTVNGGVSRPIGRHLQIDLEAGRGVTDAAPDWFVGVGFAVLGHVGR